MELKFEIADNQVYQLFEEAVGNMAGFDLLYKDKAEKPQNPLYILCQNIHNQLAPGISEPDRNAAYKRVREAMGIPEPQNPVQTPPEQQQLPQQQQNQQTEDVEFTEADNESVAMLDETTQPVQPAQNNSQEKPVQQ